MLRAKIIHSFFLLIILQPYGVLGQQDDEYELSFNRYLEIHEWSGKKHLDLVKDMSDSTILLFMSNESIHFSRIKKVVLVKTKHPTILDIEAGASIGYTAGSLVGFAAAIDSGSEVAFFVAPVIGIIAGAIIGGSISGKDIRNRFVVKGRLDRFQDLQPLLAKYFYEEALNY